MSNKEGFIDINKYPEVRDICDIVAENAHKLARVSQVLPFQPWYDTELYNHGWNVAAMRYAFVDHNPLFKWFSTPIIQTSGYSKLDPGAHILPHRGYAGDVFRIHFGLDCPQGDCQLRVGDETRAWKNGEFLMFNDLDEHEAWNNTDAPRLVLLFDIYKPLIKDLDPDDVRIPNSTIAQS